VRLNHVTLEANDVESSAHFYARLGLVQIVADYPDYARLVAPRGDTTLSLHHAESTVPESRASIHFEVDDVDHVVDKLKRAGFLFVCDPVDQPYLWREAILLDPDGHRVFIYHAGENRLDPPWRLARDTGTLRAPIPNATQGLGDHGHGDSTESEDPACTIHRAGERDIASLLDLWEGAGSPPSVSDTPEGLSRLLSTDRDALLVARSEGAVVGSLIAAWDGWRGSFYKLVVHPSHRRQGLATELLREGERHLLARGAVRLTAIVIENDQAASGFWRAVGYERQSQRSRFVRHVES
jgi:ribosomal protein S18 acetylase RimI-like enzyme/catechol 2,3-dioxygenase-like lactoylglutathione lyase family enzyme